MPLPNGLGGRGLGQEVGPVAKHPHEIDDVPDIPVDKLPADVMLNSEYNLQHGGPPDMPLNTHIFRSAAGGGFNDAYNLKVISESIVITIAGGVDYDYNFPDGGFPNGVFAIVACQGDQTAGNAAIIAKPTNNQTVRFNIQTGFNGLIRINYIAIGF